MQGKITNMKVEDAIKFVKYTIGKSFYLMVGQTSQLVADERIGFPVVGAIKVSKKDAVKFIKNTYSSPRVKAEGTVQIDEHDVCVFIGKPA